MPFDKLETWLGVRRRYPAAAVLVLCEPELSSLAMLPRVAEGIATIVVAGESCGLNAPLLLHQGVRGILSVMDILDRPAVQITASAGRDENVARAGNSRDLRSEVTTLARCSARHVMQSVLRSCSVFVVSKYIKCERSLRLQFAFLVCGLPHTSEF